MPKKKVKREFDAIVEFAGVEKFIDTPIKRYSFGMRLRLGFAVAAPLELDILIVDEVLAVATPPSRRSVSIPFNLAAVEKLCEPCVWIDAGRALNLLATKYTISLWISNQARRVFYDNIENAVTLEVDAAKPYGSNFIVDGRFGIVFFPQKWNLAGMSRQTEDSLSGSRNLKES